MNSALIMSFTVCRELNLYFINGMEFAEHTTNESVTKTELARCDERAKIIDGNCFSSLLMMSQQSLQKFD